MAKRITYFMVIENATSSRTFDFSPSIPDNADDLNSQETIDAIKTAIQTSMGRVLEVEQAKDPTLEFVRWFSHDDHGNQIEESDVLVIPV